MTHPEPTARTFRPLYTVEEEEELAARRSVHAGMLPTNMEHHTPANGDWYGYGGTEESAEQAMRGWTAQQPFQHVNCDVMHVCIFCSKMIDPDYLRSHECAVRAELASIH